MPTLRINDNGIKRRTDAYGRDVNLLGRPAIGSKAYWAPSINLPQYQRELMNTGNERFLQEQTAAQRAGQSTGQTGIARTNDEIMRSMSFDEPAPAQIVEAPEYVKSKQIQDWNTVYSKEIPRMGEAKTLAEYKDQWERIQKIAANSGYSTDAISKEIEEQYYRKNMPDAVKLEQQTQDLMTSLTPEQKERYEVVGGKIQLNPQWALKNELNTIEEREKQKSKLGLGALGNEQWQAIPRETQSTLIKELDTLKSQRDHREEAIAKAQSKINAMIKQGDDVEQEQQELKLMMQTRKNIQAEIDAIVKPFGLFTALSPATEATPGSTLAIDKAAEMAKPTEQYIVNDQGQKMVVRNGQWQPL